MDIFLRSFCTFFLLAAPFTASAQTYSYRLDKYRDNSVELCRMIAAIDMEKQKSECSENNAFCLKIESALKNHDANNCLEIVDHVIKAMNEEITGENFPEFSKHIDFGQNNDPVSHVIVYYVLWQIRQSTLAFSEEHKRSIPKDKDALPIVRKRPRVPKGAHRNGHCNLVFDVDASGHPKNIKVISCTDPIFEKEAIKAVRQFKYRPKVIYGEPHPRTGVETRVPFRVVDENGKMVRE